MAKSSLKGFFWKQKPGKTSQWDSRVFSLEDDRITWQDPTSAAISKKSIRLSDIKNVYLHEFEARQLPSELQTFADNGLCIRTGGLRGTYNLITEKSETAQTWLDVLLERTEASADRVRSTSQLSAGGVSIASSGSDDSARQSDRHRSRSVTFADKPRVRQIPGRSESENGTENEDEDDEELALPEDDDKPDFAAAVALEPARANDGDGDAGVGRGDQGAEPHEQRSRANSGVSRSGSSSRDTIKLSLGRGKVKPISGEFDAREQLQAKVNTLFEGYSPSLLHVNLLGQVAELPESPSPIVLSKRGHTFFVALPGSTVVAFFFESGKFAAEVLPEDITTKELLELKSKRWIASSKLVQLVEQSAFSLPGLFWKPKEGKEQQFAAADKPVEFLLSQPADTGRLIFKDKALKPRMGAPHVPLAADPISASLLKVKGFLMKRGAAQRSLGSLPTSRAWRRRWCVFSEGVLQYFERVADPTPKGQISVEEMTSVVPFHESGKDRRPNTFEIQTSGKRNYIFSAESSTDFNRWVATLEKVIRKADKVGFLYKKGDRINTTWKHRWFVLRGTSLHYYVSQGDDAAKSMIELSRAQAVEQLPEEDVFDDFCFQIVCDNRVWVLRADTRADMLDWISAIQVAMPVEKVVRQGSLLKKGEKNSAWRMRYFELSQSQLAYFENESSKTYKNHVLLSRVQEVTPVASSEGFEFHIHVLSRTYELRAASAEEREAWIEDISQAAAKLKDSVVSDDDEQEDTPSAMTVPIIRPDEDEATPPDHMRGHMVDKSYTYDVPELPPAPLDVASARADWLSMEGKGISDEEWARQEEEYRLSRQEDSEVSASIQSVLLGSVPQGSLEAKAAASMQYDDDEQSGDENTLWGGDEMSHDDEERLLTFDAPDAAKHYEVMSPSLLRVVLHSIKSNTDDVIGATVVSLSGCKLSYSNGSWSLMPGSRWHVLPKDGGGHREELRISASIVAIFNHDSAQWCVPDPALYHALPIATSADGTPVRPRAPTMAPDAQLFIKAGGMDLIGLADKAVKQIVVHACNLDDDGTTTSPEQQRQETIRRCDDQADRTIGVLVRRHFCSALIKILINGLIAKRMFGFVQATAWDLIQDATPRPDAATPPRMRQAYRAMRDLQNNVNMNDNPHIRARSFICASLNHQFLDPWLVSLYNNKKMLSKWYRPHAFLRLCTVPMFEEFLLTLNPLALLPFRLHTSFELKRVMSLRTRSSGRKQQRNGGSVSLRRTSSGSTDDNMHETTPTTVVDLQPGETVIVRALYTNDVPDDDIELNFQRGDFMVVEHMNQTMPEWCTCSLHGRKGLVPLCYVEVLDEMEAAAHLQAMSEC